MQITLNNPFFMNKLVYRIYGYFGQWLLYREKDILLQVFMGHFRADDDDVRNNLLNKTEVSQQTRGCESWIH